jgi:hypothetical protein
MTVAAQDSLDKINAAVKATAKAPRMPEEAKVASTLDIALAVCALTTRNTD